MNELDKVSELSATARDLFGLLRSRFEYITLGDENGNKTDEPELARFFNFDYVSKDGKNFGNVLLHLMRPQQASHNSLQVVFSKNITKDLSDDQKREWFEFVRNRLSGFAKRNLLTYDVRDITSDGLDLRTIRQMAKTSESYTQSEATPMTESQLFGTTRTSYQHVGPARLIVRHSQKIDDERHGARTRKIESIFVETIEGERFKLPFNNLHGARAMARHIAEGGTVLDEQAAHIVETVTELGAMSMFVRSMQHRIFEDGETAQMVEAAVRRYKKLKENLKIMSGTRGYSKYFGNLQLSPVESTEETDINALRERFTKKIFDDRLADALPYVQRAYQEFQMNETKMSHEFEQWVNEVVEEISADPVSDDTLTPELDIAALQDLMSSELPVGVDATNAIPLVHEITGLDNDTLIKNLLTFYEISGGSADARSVIYAWIKEKYPNLVDMLGYTPTSQGNQQQPPGKLQTQPPATAESIDFIRQLAGIKR